MFINQCGPMLVWVFAFCHSLSDFVEINREFYLLPNLRGKGGAYFFAHLSKAQDELRGSCKRFCHWVRITSVLRFIKHIFITNLQSIPPLPKHIFVTFLPGREKQINSFLLVSVGDTDK